MKVTLESIQAAVEQLNGSEAGTAALRQLNGLMGGPSLDARNQAACATLLQGFWGAWPGTTRDLIQEALS